jgi:hypothetical protein
MTAAISTFVTYTEQDCGQCGVWFAMDSRFRDERVKDHLTWYCPNGHPRAFVGETEAQKERRLRKQAEDRLAAERARADGAEASLRATKGHVTRLRKRVIEGECPLCGQHLRDLARHVARVHPGESVEPPDA